MPFDQTTALITVAGLIAERDALTAALAEARAGWAESGKALADALLALAAERELTAALDAMLMIYKTGNTRHGAATAERLTLARHRAARQPQEATDER